MVLQFKKNCIFLISLLYKTTFLGKIGAKPDEQNARKPSLIKPVNCVQSRSEIGSEKQSFHVNKDISAVRDGRKV